jgi:hypothetical protein
VGLVQKEEVLQKENRRKKQTRHENTRVGSKALLRFCVVDLCLADITAIKILKNSETIFNNLFPALPLSISIFIPYIPKSIGAQLDSHWFVVIYV